MPSPILLNITKDITSIISSATKDATRKSFTKFVISLGVYDHNMLQLQVIMLQTFRVEKFGVSPTQLLNQHSNNTATIEIHYEQKKLARLLRT